MAHGQDVPATGPLAREWLLGDGLGGSASGTAAGVRTRRSHALLTAAGPHGRPLARLLAVDARLGTEAGTFELSAHFTGSGMLRPPAHVAPDDFRLDPWPTWRWRAGGARIEQTLFTLHRHDAVAIAWRLIEGDPARLLLAPLVGARHPHALQAEDAALPGVTQAIPGRVRLEMGEGLTPLVLWHNATFFPSRVWKRGLHFPLDAHHDETGEDAFVPGYLDAMLTPGKPALLVASTEPDLFRALAAEERLGLPPPQSLAGCFAVLEQGERERVQRWRKAALAGADFTARQAAVAHGGAAETAARRPEPLIGPDDPHAARLALALRAGLAKRAHRLGIVGALPGGGERGDEALRSVAALVSLRAFEPARDVLRGYVEWLDEGLAPERFGDDGTPLYGDPAPTLWLVYAADLFARRSGEGDWLAKTLFPALDQAMHELRSGTRGGTRVDSDGLLSTGEGEWARKRADLNALWYHALVAMAQLARLIGQREGGAFYLAWARDHQRRFHERFWDEAGGCLFDAIGADGPRPGLTPSQVLAVGLPPALLPPERAERLLATLERELLTSCGLREHRGADRASVAWLGPFAAAWLRTRQRDPHAQARVRGWLEAALALPGAAGHVPGTVRVDAAGHFTGVLDDPASPLAAAELLRVWIEEIERAPRTSDVALEPR